MNVVLVIQKDLQMWQLLMNLSEKSTYFVHNDFSFGKVMSNHGLVNDKIINIYYICKVVSF